MVAIATLDTVWINVASDPTNYQIFPLMSALKVTTTQTGEVRLYANGRRRIVRRAAPAKELSLSLPECTRVQIAWLELYVGQLVCVRDDRGRKIWCTYFIVPIDETNGDQTVGNVEIQLEEVTYTETV